MMSQEAALHVLLTGTMSEVTQLMAMLQTGPRGLDLSAKMRLM